MVEEQLQNQNRINKGKMNHEKIDVDRLEIAPPSRTKFGPFEYSLIAVVTAVLGLTGYLAVTGYKYDQHRVVKKETAPLKIALHDSSKVIRNLKKEREALDGRIETLRADSSGLVSRLDSAENSTNKLRTAVRNLVEQKKNLQTRADSAESAKLALVEAYPSDIRDFEYSYKEKPDGRFAALGIKRSYSQDPVELNRRKAFLKTFDEEKYPTLRSEIEDRRKGRTIVEKDGVLIMKKDERVYAIKVKYQDGSSSEFTYKAPRLINPKEDK